MVVTSVYMKNFKHLILKEHWDEWCIRLGFRAWLGNRIILFSSTLLFFNIIHFPGIKLVNFFLDWTNSAFSPASHMNTSFQYTYAHMCMHVYKVPNSIIVVAGDNHNFILSSVSYEEWESIYLFLSWILVKSLFWI